MPTRNALIKSASIGSLSLGATAVVMGTAAAALHGNLQIIPASICLLFGFFAQLTINFSHRYNDEKHGFGENEADRISTTRSGISATVLLREATIGMMLISGMLGLTLIAWGRWMMVLFAVILVVLAILYNIGRHPVSRTPWSPLFMFLSYGVVATLAVCYVQSQHESPHTINWYDLGPPLLLGGSVGFMTINWLLTYNHLTYQHDLLNDKRSPMVKWGRKIIGTMIVVNSLLSVVMAVATYYACQPTYGPWLIIPSAIAVIPYSWLGVRLRRTAPGESTRLLTAAGIIMIAVAAATFAVICATGHPYDSYLEIF